MYGDAQQDGSSLLVKFDLTNAPPRRSIQRAILSLYAVNRTNTAPLSLRAYVCW